MASWEEEAPLIKETPYATLLPTRYIGLRTLARAGEIQCEPLLHRYDAYRS